MNEKQRGQTLKNMSKFKLDWRNSYKYSLVPLQIVVPRVNEGMICI